MMGNPVPRSGDGTDLRTVHVGYSEDYPILSVIRDKPFLDGQTRSLNLAKKIDINNPRK